MCGINGIIDFGNRDSSDIAEKLKVMQEATKHRGPDESGTIVLPKAGLGMNRLSIVAPDVSSTVHSSREKILHLAFNGEIVNHKSIRQELQSPPSERDSDTAVILPLLEQEGEDYVKHLAGMFAFAVYDQIKHTLELVRDPLGIKPLYYSQNNGRVLFSSELKAIRAATDGHLPPDFASLDDHLKYRFHPGRDSVFRHIKRVLPGERILFSEDSVLDRKNFWSLKPNVKSLEGNLDDKIEECRKVLEEIVAENVQGDVKGGYFVSGGLDSSLITAMGLRHDSQYKHPISLRFTPKPVVDEGYAAQLEDALKTDFEWVEISDEGARVALEEAVKFMDEPLENPIHIGTYLMAERAKNLGIKSVLTGDGSDEFFIGYDRHKPWFGGSQNPSKDYPPFLWAVSPELANALYRDEAKEQVTAMKGYDGNLIEPFNTTEDALHFERFDRLTEYHCNRLDRMTMGHSVEARVPFLDHRLIETGLTIPHQIHIGESGKEFLQKVAEPFLPKEIIYRPKIHFPSLVNQWTRGDGIEWVKQHLLNSSAMISKWIKQDALREIITQHEKNQENHGRALWALMTLELWLQKHVQ